MPDVWKAAVKPHPIAILCADIHLSLTAPPARASEPDWFQAMARPLRELNNLAKEYKVPILCAGDVFDKWDAKPELINFALEHLPPMYAVPGQHDLPYHAGADVHKSALGVMVKVDRVKLLSPTKPVLIRGAYVWGFGWGEEIRPGYSITGEITPSALCVAIVHAYCWRPGSQHTGASENAHVNKFREKLKGYQVGVFGDNHRGFLDEGEQLTLFNCGGFMRRKSDEDWRKPMVGILYSNSRVRTHRLNTEDEKMDITSDTLKKEKENTEINEFVQGLAQLESQPFDFASAVKHYLETNTVSEGTYKILLSAIAHK